jgi:hypothetical protein
MEARAPRRVRSTGAMVVDPALYQLVMASGALVDRLICACASPIDAQAPPDSAAEPARRPGGGAPAGGPPRMN